MSIINKIYLELNLLYKKFFKRFFLESDTPYSAPLQNPQVSTRYIFNLILCKLNYLYVILFYKNKL